ncbi:2-acylglycerol O-acyltransferase 2 [Anolis sagrei]|uniref:2-acylglycerol O-acyltransferase 2 n=1 Tax=Anolis sagrei TaxID=38937 RepID=UPI0035210F45
MGKLGKLEWIQRMVTKMVKGLKAKLSEEWLRNLAPLCIVTFIGLVFTRFWLISVLYGAWWAYDWDKPRNGGRKINLIRNSAVWRYMKDYFPITLVKTVDLDPAKNYVFGFHPHGILVAGAFVNFCTEATGFSKMFRGLSPHLMLLDLWFRAPFFRDYVMSGGLVASEKESAAHILRKPGGGNVLIIAVGGAREALDARPGAFTLLLANRKGFVRQALQHGASLVPVFSFGENELFDQVENPPGSWLRCTQEVLQRFMGVSLPLFHARGIFQYSFGLLPYRKPIFTVVGKPISVEKNPNPSQEEVDDLHQLYMEELSKLFEDHKLKYNVPEDKHLSFV